MRTGEDEAVLSIFEEAATLNSVVYIRMRSASFPNHKQRVHHPSGDSKPRLETVIASTTIQGRWVFSTFLISNP
jgi:hypothetical protein